MLNILRFAAIVLGGLLVGSGVGLWFIDHKLDGSGAFYTEYKQLVIRAYAVPLPILGFGTTGLAVAVPVLGRGPGHVLAGARCGGSPHRRHRGHRRRALPGQHRDRRVVLGCAACRLGACARPLARVQRRPGRSEHDRIRGPAAVCHADRPFLTEVIPP